MAEARAAFQRIGLLVNPRAGRGAAANLSAGRQAVEALRSEAIVTGPGELGAAALEGWPGAVEVCPAPEPAGRDQSMALARALAGRDIQALVVVGGDGTLADVALALLDVPVSAPLLGLGAGAINAGPLITYPAERAGQLDPARLEACSFDGVQAYYNGELVGLGFNDAVITFTVVGRLEGRLRDLEAASQLSGRAVPGQPRSIATARARVTRSGAGPATTLARGEAVGTVVVGFAERAFFGKAITGGVCLATLAGLPAGCLVADRPLAVVEVEAATLLGWTPLISRYVSLRDDSRIVVGGVREGAALCADGTPLRLLANGDRAEFAVRRAAATALRLMES